MYTMTILPIGRTAGVLTVMPNAMTKTKTEIVKSLGDCPSGHFQRAFGLTNFWRQKNILLGTVPH